MSEPQKKFYLTTPIYYVNARPHIGHAYTTIAADVIARRHRLLGDDTFLLTGTDEHGQKIERSAAAAGIPPQQFADQVSASFENLWKRMGITNDAYIRTTDEKHKRGVQKLWETLFDRGAIYLSTYTGQYSIGEEMFVEGPPGTIGPDGKPTETVTEENYFFKLSEYQLPLLNLIESGELSIQPEVRKNEVLSFLKGNVAVALNEYRESSGEDAIDHLYSEEGIEAGIKSGHLSRTAMGALYVPGALKDLSISRSSFKWGIPVPSDEKHVVYVWLDALANYMTALGYGSEDESKFNHYWPADLHLVGKEIIRFHCVYWPAFLMAAGLPLPKAITAHGWLLFEDSKMSKSRGNIVRTETILDAFGTLCPPQPQPQPQHPPQPSLSLSSRSEAEGSAVSSDAPPTPPTKREQDLFASDVLRYFLLREIPFGQDGSFSFDALFTRYNADLVNGFGNLVSRTLTLANAHFREDTPPPHAPFLCEEWQPNTDGKKSTSVSEALSGTATVIKEICQLAKIDFDFYAQQNHFHLALGEVFSRISIVDGYLSWHKPWLLAKETDYKAKLIEVLYTAAESIRIITALLYPILPYATSKVWTQLGLGDIELAAKNGDLKNLQWGGLQPGTKLGPLSPIFPRAPKELIQIMTDMETPATPAPSKLVDEKTTHTTPEQQDPTHPAAPPRTSSLTEQNPGTHVAASAAVTTERPAIPTGPQSIPSAESVVESFPTIAIDDFIKIDLRVAKIIVAERIPKADKLLRLEVDLGYETRQILSGIAEWYTPEELIGRKIVIIANLAPRKMRGLESHGMLLAASHGEGGKPVLATFGEEIELGSRLK